MITSIHEPRSYYEVIKDSNWIIAM